MMSDSALCRLSDEQVVELAKSGDEDAYKHLMARYRNYVYVKAKTYYLKGAEQDDLVQEGMIGLYKAVRDYNPERSAFRAFAKVCVLRQILTAVKNSTRNKHVPLNTYVSLNVNANDNPEDEYWLDIADEKNSCNPEAMLIDQENLSGIEYRINQILSKMELEVLAYYIDGFSYREIAQKTGRDAKAVDNAIQRIRKKIEKVLGK